MKLLLDTHVWIWSLQQPQKINIRVRRQLEDSKSEIFLSPISIWEAHHMALRKKLRTKISFTLWLEEMLRRIPLRDAPLSFAVAAEASKIQLPQGDLGDTFLAATCLAYDLTLVTSDQQLLDAKWLKTIAA